MSDSICSANGSATRSLTFKGRTKGLSFKGRRPNWNEETHGSSNNSIVARTWCMIASDFRSFLLAPQNDVTRSSFSDGSMHAFTHFCACCPLPGCDLSFYVCVYMYMLARGHASTHRALIRTTALFLPDRIYAAARSASSRAAVGAYREVPNLSS